MKKLILLCLLIFIYFQSSWGQEDAVTTVILVRHAEPYFPPYKETPPNPALNFAGQKRAQQLAATLRDIKIDKIYSTDLIRTKQTVRPLAVARNLDIITYDHTDLEGFAGAILKEPGRYLVSGHSNTTPQMVELLGGDPGEPINNTSEFDRMYLLIITNGKVITRQLRYGQRYE